MKIIPFIKKGTRIPKHIRKSFNLGWGNGYALIPPGCSEYFIGKDEWEIEAMYPFPAPYGVTFSGYPDRILTDKQLKKLGIDNPKKWWCIGFDTLHPNAGELFGKKKDVKRAAILLSSSIEHYCNIKKLHSFNRQLRNVRNFLN